MSDRTSLSKIQSSSLRDGDSNGDVIGQVSNSSVSDRQSASSYEGTLSQYLRNQGEVSSTDDSDSLDATANTSHDPYEALLTAILNGAPDQREETPDSAVLPVSDRVENKEVNVNGSGAERTAKEMMIMIRSLIAVYQLFTGQKNLEEFNRDAEKIISDYNSLQGGIGSNGSEKSGAQIANSGSNTSGVSGGSVPLDRDRLDQVSPERFMVSPNEGQDQSSSALTERIQIPNDMASDGDTSLVDSRAASMDFSASPESVKRVLAQFIDSIPTSDRGRPLAESVKKMLNQIVDRSLLNANSSSSATDDDNPMVESVSKKRELTLKAIREFIQLSEGSQSKIEFTRDFEQIVTEFENLETLDAEPVDVSERLVDHDIATQLDESSNGAARNYGTSIRDASSTGSPMNSRPFMLDFLDQDGRDPALFD